MTPGCACSSAPGAGCAPTRSPPSSTRGAGDERRLRPLRGRRRRLATGGARPDRLRGADAGAGGGPGRGPAPRLRAGDLGGHRHRRRRRPQRGRRCSTATTSPSATRWRPTARRPFRSRLRRADEVADRLHAAPGAALRAPGRSPRRAYLGSLAFVAFVYSNPIVLAGAGGAVAVAGLLAGARDALVAAARWGLALGVLLIVVNAIASQRGDTILLRGGELPVLGRIDVSAEALVEGAVLALRIAVVLCAFAVHSACVDPDRMLRLLRPFARHSALTATLITRMVPARRGRPRAAARGAGAARPRRRSRQPRGARPAAGRRLARPRGRDRRDPRAARLRARGPAAGAGAARLAARLAVRSRRGGDRGAGDRRADRGRRRLRGLPDDRARRRPGDARRSPPPCRCWPPPRTWDSGGRPARGR